MTCHTEQVAIYTSAAAEYRVNAAPAETAPPCASPNKYRSHYLPGERQNAPDLSYCNLYLVSHTAGSAAPHPVTAANMAS